MITTTVEAAAAPSATTSARPGPRGPVVARRAPADDVPGGRLHSVDGVRFLAALGVVVYHYTALWSTVWGEDPGDRFPTVGPAVMYLSVAPELFFVVSGFVVLWTAWGRSVPQIVASRLARLYPAYWAALAATSVLLLVIWPAGKRITLGEVAVNATLLQEALGVRNVDGVYWTLYAELRFYLLVAVFAAVGITRRRVVAVAALWPVAAVVVERLGWDGVAELLISRYAPFFAAGMLLFLVYRDGHTRPLWALIGVNTVLAVATNLPVKAHELRTATAFEPVTWLLAGALVACVAAVALVALTPVRRLSWRHLATLGAITYPLYLVHQFWGWWVIAHLSPYVPTPVALLAAVALALVLALAIHRLVEVRVNGRARRQLEASLTRAASALRHAAHRARGQGAGDDLLPERGRGGRVEEHGRPDVARAVVETRDGRRAADATRAGRVPERQGQPAHVHDVGALADRQGAQARADEAHLAGRLPQE